MGFTCGLRAIAVEGVYLLVRRGAQSRKYIRKVPQVSHNPIFQRLEIIAGGEGIRALASTRVIVFGIGGVGSWCAEALVRSGVGTIALVDSDVVCITNVNRQVQATTASVGKPKVTELADRMRLVNPKAEIIPLQTVFSRATAHEFDLGGYAYVVDAIDSLSNKVDLIIAACKAGAKVFSALGASNKLDPLQIRVDSLWKSQGCPLGRYIRKRLRRKGFDGDVTCVYSEENLPLRPAGNACGTGDCVCPKTAQQAGAGPTAAHEWCSTKKQINGSAVHVTGTFGFYLAGLVIQDVVGGAAEPAPES
jgi:tRNA threonylcarbamoyladenosine dehydratase